MPRPISITMFCVYVDSSMFFANAQTIPSVTGIDTAAKSSGSRNESVPKTKTRSRNAIGIAMNSSPTLRSREKTGSRSCSIAACPVT